MVHVNVSTTITMLNTQTQQALLVIMVHASMADGDKSQSERDFIRDLAQQLNEQSGSIQLVQAIQSALLGRMNVKQAVDMLQDPMHRQLAFEWATAVCHADGVCSPAEAAFLQRLQQDLKLAGAAPSHDAQQAQSLAIAAYQQEAVAPLAAPAVAAAAVATAPAASANTVDEASLDRMILNYAILNLSLIHI